jgi:hypothetical protein
MWRKKKKLKGLLWNFKRVGVDFNKEREKRKRPSAPNSMRF